MAQETRNENKNITLDTIGAGLGALGLMFGAKKANNNYENLKSKKDFYDKSIEYHTEKIKDYEEALKESNKKLDEAKTNYEKLKNLIKEKNGSKKMEDKLSEALRNLKRAEKKHERTLGLYEHNNKTIKELSMENEKIEKPLKRFKLARNIAGVGAAGLGLYA